MLPLTGFAKMDHLRNGMNTLGTKKFCTIEEFEYTRFSENFDIYCINSDPFLQQTKSHGPFTSVFPIKILKDFQFMRSIFRN